MSDEGLRQRSIRTLAWLGDAEWEREIRLRLVRRGDFRLDRLDAARARCSRAETQAALLDEVLELLTEEEASVVSRGRNASHSVSSRSSRDTKAYRAATGLEALVGWWFVGGEAGQVRFETVFGARLERLVDEALARSDKPRRG